MTPYRAKTRLPLLALLPLALALQACSAGPYDPETQRSELRAARARWESQGIRDYSFTVGRVCFCGSETTGPVRVEVRGGQTVSVAPLDPAVSIRREAFPGTVEALFAEVEEAISRRPYSLSVQYDPALGYPNALFVDYERRAVDEESGFNVGGFQRND